MKKFTFLLLMFVNVGFTQITFFNYLNYTSEWRQYRGGLGETGYNTYYLDGDQTFGSITYYNFYRSEHKIETNIYFGGTTITDTVYGPGYLREDSNGKFWFYDPETNTETLWFDNQPVINANIGDTYNFTGANCVIENIVNYPLGSRTLKRICGQYTTGCTGSMEGVGDIGMVCSAGYEFTSYMACYTKDGNTISFGNSDCSLYPVPNRSSLSIIENTENTFAVFPNPSNGVFNIVTNWDNSEKKYSITNLVGLVVKKGYLNNTMSIDLSDVSSGVYILNITNNIGMVTKKIIKQ
ncbi:T9SS type A sorting domain-containing protein [Flavobacterium sp. AS60]|uniref:T9SS type A sorting domain-containing protein n=1 Tax=Flavobacterium anseongense TaxID=2910677 RepID=UPI001F3150CA|nr:T9SS type A sorting domain-containing protein [Flavobacterium sp. AS60]MCF6130461.1 T9SS type A sorting domain-containing protein [Flavobacterium sp. AS60]